jgi:integrase
MPARSFTVGLYERPNSPCWWACVYVEGEGGKKHRFSTEIQILPDRRQSRRMATRAAEDRGRSIAVEVADDPDFSRASEAKTALAAVGQRLIAQKTADGRRELAVDALAWIIDRRVRPFFKDERDVRSIRRADLEAFKAHLRGKGLAPTSINNALTGIRQILKYAFAVEELIESVPMVANVPIDRTPKGRALTADQVDRLISKIDKRAVEARHFLVFIANTGLRKSEALSIRFSWIDWKHRLLFIPSTERKGGRPREPVALNATAIGVLRERLALHPQRKDPSDDRVFRQKKHDGARNSAATRAGIGRVRNHDLRHTLGSLHVAAGATLTEARDTLGHTTMAMVNHYQHGYLDRRRRTADRVQLGTRKGKKSPTKRVDK